MSLTRKRRSTGKVTLADVAQLAGVGTMTVSRALRTPEQVSDKLRENRSRGTRVRLYAESCSQCAGFGLVVDDRDGRPQSFRSRLFRNVRRAPAGVTARRYQIMLAESQHRLEQEEKLLETLLASNIAAAILLSVEHTDTVRHWLKRLDSGDGDGRHARRSYRYEYRD